MRAGDGDVVSVKNGVGGVSTGLSSQEPWAVIV